jgi:mRNA interferase HicA
MKGSELVKKLRKLAKIKGVEFKLVKERGKSSHGTLYWDNKFSTIPNLKDELKSGTLQAILNQLRIKRDDLS